MFITTIFGIFQILTDAEGFSLLLTKLLSLSESTPAVQEWLRGPVLGSHLVKVVKELWSSSQPADSKRLVTGWGIISMVLSSSGNKGLCYLLAPSYENITQGRFS